MFSVPANQWKHTTATHHQGCDKYDGIDLFDDEDEGHVSIYVRFTDGTRFPARTVCLDTPDDPGHAQIVLGAWAQRGQVHDYRSNKMPAI
jgi:hypothetical protein